MNYIKLFKEHIESTFGTSKFLYHTTHIVYFPRILKTNRLISQINSANANTREFPAISMSRDDVFFYDEQPFRFKLDRSKLSQDYEIEPYLDPIFDGRDPEKEEISRKTIDNLSKYLVTIQISTYEPILSYLDINEVKESLESLDEYLQKHTHIKLESVNKDGVCKSINISEAYSIFGLLF